MESGFVERRRSPRVPMGSGAVAVMPASMAVRLLDLSSQGVLLACPDPVLPGTPSRVAARLGDRSFDTELDIRHVSSEFDRRLGGYRVGGCFLALSPQSKQAVEVLLSGSERAD